MSTGAIIAIAVAAAIILIALLVLLPRMRERARIRQSERELQRRRDQAATEHRQQAEARAERASEAEQRARLAEQEARRERAEAELLHERAQASARGMADDQLIEDHERDRFAGTSAGSGPGAEDSTSQNGGDRDADRGTTTGGADRTTAYQEGRMAAHDPGREQDFEEGQSDERGGLFGRFRRRSTREREPAQRS